MTVLRKSRRARGWARHNTPQGGSLSNYNHRRAFGHFVSFFDALASLVVGIGCMFAGVGYIPLGAWVGYYRGSDDWLKQYGHKGRTGPGWLRPVDGDWTWISPRYRRRPRFGYSESATA